MWLSYVCNFCNWCLINSHEQNIQFLHDSLQEQSEQDFGDIYVFGGELAFSIIFGLFCARFMLLFTYNLAQVYMSCVLTFWHQSMKCILLCFHGKLWYQKGMSIIVMYITPQNLSNFFHNMHQHVTVFIHNIVMYITVA